MDMQQRMKMQQRLTGLWAATILTKGIYTFLWYGYSTDTGLNRGPSSNIATAIALGVIALLIVSFAIYLSKRIHSLPPTLIKMMGQKPSGGELDPMLVFTVTAVSLGCVESPVLFGLTNYYLNGNSYIYFGFLALSLIGWVVIKPNILRNSKGFDSQSVESDFSSPE